MRLGGLGLRSAERTAPAAYWGSWADTMKVISDRAPRVATTILADLSRETQQCKCLQQLTDARRLLSREGFARMPSWESLSRGERPDAHFASEPGEWPHGWQFFASSTREHHFRTNEILAASSPADCAHLRSRSGPGSGCVLAGCPTAIEYTIPAFDFRVLLLDRLRLSLPLTDVRCEGCGKSLDAFGRHRTSCMISGRIRKRAAPIEVMTCRVCREAGALVKSNVFLRDMNICVSASDERRIEVLAHGLSVRHGGQLAVDVTLRASTSAENIAHPHAADIDGTVASAARRSKECKYPELANGRCSLVVLALEVGGRWSQEAIEFIRDLSWAKASETCTTSRATVARA